MSFLDVQDLATVAAQADFGAWCCDLGTLFDAVEAGLGACLVGFAIRWRRKR